MRYAGVVRESGHAGFRRRGIPLVHRVAVAGPFRRRGVAALLMDAAGVRVALRAPIGARRAPWRQAG
jgi:hypothetical protein